MISFCYGCKFVIQFISENMCRSSNFRSNCELICHWTLSIIPTFRHWTTDFESQSVFSHDRSSSECTWTNYLESSTTRLRSISKRFRSYAWKYCHLTRCNLTLARDRSQKKRYKKPRAQWTKDWEEIIAGWTIWNIWIKSSISCGKKQNKNFWSDFFEKK